MVVLINKIVEEKLLKNLLILKILPERLDLTNAEDFKKIVLKYIDDGNINLVLNLSNINFLDSTGLGALVVIFKRLNKKGYFSICCANESVTSLFNLTRMNRLFNIFFTEEESIKALQNK